MVDYIDEEIQSEDANENSHREGIKYTHPSFGMVRVSRFNGPEQKFFGAGVAVSGGMSITISQANVTQDLGRNWYYSYETVCEVEMSPVQYAELITSPNTEGQPCTIKTIVGKGHIIPKNIDTVTQYVEDTIDRHVSDCNKRIIELEERVKGILSQKGTLKKADKEEVNSLVFKLVQDLKSSLPFYEKSALKSIDKAKTEAKVEVDSYVAHAINRVGMEALSNPEALKVLIDGVERAEVKDVVPAIEHEDK